LDLKIITDFCSIEADQWDSLVTDDFPFARHAFLSSLFDGGCLGEERGWIPRFITLWDGQQLVAALPLFLKDNSYGEYIFDWDWANAYSSNGRDYFPKLVCAYPFTPATGRKILLRDQSRLMEWGGQLIERALALVNETGASSLHFLFLHADELPLFKKYEFLMRKSFQFHFENKSYGEFDRFTAVLKKSKERNALIRGEVQIEELSGLQLLKDCGEDFYPYYLSTIHKKGAIPYLGQKFFKLVFERMGDQILLVKAKSDGKDLAQALYFYNKEALYGRYWGSPHEIKFLHFEMCIYRGLEYTLRNGLTLFEAGAQGPHKVSRGFLPVNCHSAHFIAHPGFKAAIAGYICEEEKSIANMIERKEDYNPYK